jgi:hypothetical protein
MILRFILRFILRWWFDGLSDFTGNFLSVHPRALSRSASLFRQRGVGVRVRPHSIQSSFTVPLTRLHGPEGWIQCTSGGLQIALQVVYGTVLQDRPTLLAGRGMDPASFFSRTILKRDDWQICPNLRSGHLLYFNSRLSLGEPNKSVHRSLVRFEVYCYERANQFSIGS